LTISGRPRERSRSIRKGCPIKSSFLIAALKDAVIRNFEVIGEAIKNLPDDVKARYPGVEWKQTAGLRDVIAHGYFHIDFEVIWEIVTDRIPGFKKDIAKILREETRHEKETQ